MLSPCDAAYRERESDYGGVLHRRHISDLYGDESGAGISCRPVQVNWRVSARQCGFGSVSIWRRVVLVLSGDIVDDAMEGQTTWMDCQRFPTAR